MLRGVQCLLLTSYVGLTFQLTSRSVNDVQPSATYGIVMGAVLVLANVAYVCSVLWQQVRHVDWQGIVGTVRNAGHGVHACVGKSCGACTGQPLLPAVPSAQQRGGAAASSSSVQPGHHQETHADHQHGGHGKKGDVSVVHTIP
jgi:hypothetical protein